MVTRLAFHEVTTGTASQWDLWTILVDRAGMRVGEPEAFLRTDADERESDLSPDGRWVAYAASESGGRFDVFVRAFPDDGRRWKVSDGGGVYPRWSASRSTLFFVADGLLMAAPYSVNGVVFTPGKPRVWSRQPLAAEPGPNPFPYSVSADGSARRRSGSRGRVGTGTCETSCHALGQRRHRPPAPHAVQPLT